MKKGNMALDEFTGDPDMLAANGHWLAVMKNVRAGVMPPPEKPRPTEAQQKQLTDWIKFGAFGIDPSNPDPGRVTIHRLNRMEYRNTIRQILGVDYNTNDEFPPDGAGLGFDNIADLLTMSPLVFEKYLKAAEVVLDGALPSESGRKFVVPGSDIRGNNDTTGERLSFNGSPEIVYAFRNKYPGSFRLELEIEVAMGEGSVTNISHFVFSVQSGVAPEEVLLERDFTGESRKYEFAFNSVWSIEPHVFKIHLSDPNTPPPTRRGFGFGQRSAPQPKPPAPALRIANLIITAQPTLEVGRFFFGNAPSPAAGELRDYIREGVAAFGLRAFRRPMDDRTLTVLTEETEHRYRETGLFADSVKPSFVKVLCSALS